MRNSARASQTGYSLIEILLVVVLLATVSLAITASFFQGVKVYSRFNGALDEEGKAIFMARLTRDLKNSANYSLIPWSVSDNSLSFASVTGLSVGGLNR